jgi:DNA-binding response OmpR family regulator
MPDPIRPRLLVVSDDPETGTIVRDVLGARGYAAQYVTNAQATLPRLTAFHPALVVLDMFTPLLHEWPILDGLLRLSHAPPVVALTGRCLSPDALAAVTFHGQGHLQKPFEPAALLRLCGRMLAPAPPQGLAERRADARQHVAGDATLVTAKGRSAVVLQMFDVSTSGARVEIGTLLETKLVAGAHVRMVFSLPPKFEARPVEARVEWREGGMMGISFPSLATS